MLNYYSIIVMHCRLNLSYLSSPRFSKVVNINPHVWESLNNLKLFEGVVELKLGASGLILLTNVSNLSAHGKHFLWQYRDICLRWLHELSSFRMIPKCFTLGLQAKSFQNMPWKFSCGCLLVDICNCSPKEGGLVEMSPNR